MYSWRLDLKIFSWKYVFMKIWFVDLHIQHGTLVITMLLSAIYWFSFEILMVMVCIFCVWVEICVFSYISFVQNYKKKKTQMHFICTKSQTFWRIWIWRICNFFAIGLKFVFSITFFLHKVAKRNNSNAFYLRFITNVLKILNMTNLQFFCNWVEIFVFNYILFA